MLVKGATGVVRTMEYTLYKLITHIATTAGLTSIRHQYYTTVVDQYLIYVVPKVFAMWDDFEDIQIKFSVK